MSAIRWGITGGDLLRRDSRHRPEGVLFELTPEGGLEPWVSGEPASVRREGRAEAWRWGLAAPSLKRPAPLRSPQGLTQGTLPTHPHTSARDQASRMAEGPRAPESEDPMLSWPFSAYALRL